MKTRHWLAALGFWDLEVTAYLLGEVFVDFTMPWNCGALLGGAIDVDRMIAAFSKQLAAMRFEVTDQVTPFHALMGRSSRITSLP